MASKEEEIKRLIEMMQDNNTSLEAVTLLREKGWLEDGSLAEREFEYLQLHRADLYKADFHGATIWHSDLFRANLSQAKLYKVHFIDTNLSGADLSKANLNKASLGANLDYANLQGSMLSESHLTGVELYRADLSGADLSHADLSKANLEEANFINTNLQGVNFKWASLNGANLSKAYLGGAKFYQTLLKTTNFTEACFYGTVLNNVDLSTAIGLETIEHRAASSIGIDALYKSQGKIPKVFLRGCGVNESYLENLSIDTKPLQGSLYISHHFTDRGFAKRIHDGLQEMGIRCWLDEQETEPVKHWEELGKTLYVDDVILLCCSQNSLSEKRWSEVKITIALSHEDELTRKRGEKVLALIPLDLDGYLFTDECAEKNPKTQQIRSRIAGNFNGWERDNALFEREIEKVIRALRTDGGKAPPPSPKL